MVPEDLAVTRMRAGAEPKTGVVYRFTPPANEERRSPSSHVDPERKETTKQTRSQARGESAPEKVPKQS
jgi:hypothetical protein